MEDELGMDHCQGEMHSIITTALLIFVLVCFYSNSVILYRCSLLFNSVIVELVVPSCSLTNLRGIPLCC